MPTAELIDIRRLDAAEARAHLDGLAGVLHDCVAGGASVSYMAPFSHENARAAFAELGAGERYVDARYRGQSYELRLPWPVRDFHAAHAKRYERCWPDLRAFENRVLAWPLVRECYMLSGEIDFIMKCVAPDLTSFQDFVIDDLTAAPNVASVKTTLVISRVKFEPGVPIALGQRQAAGMVRRRKA